MNQSSFYPVGTALQPWGEAEREAWRSRQRVQRSYADDVLRRIDALRAHWAVAPYGELAYPDARHPLYALRSASWRDELPVMLVTGGVHGYETSGVHGALQFAEQHSSAGCVRSPTARSMRTARHRNRPR